MGKQGWATAAERPFAILEIWHSRIELNSTLWESLSDSSPNKQCPYRSNEVPDQHVCVREGGDRLRRSAWGRDDDCLLLVVVVVTHHGGTHYCGWPTMVGACFMLTSAAGSLRVINMSAWGQQPEQPHLPMIGNFRLAPAPRCWWWLEVNAVVELDLVWCTRVHINRYGIHVYISNCNRDC